MAGGPDGGLTDVDPRLLLGVGARAGRAEVRAAHRRLRRALDPARGGTPELARLVDDAAALLTGGSPAPLVVDPDPRRVLGVAADAAADDVHAAYRRLSLLVHPDRGGTDELFRVVAAAHEAVVAPRTRTTGAARRRTWPSASTAPPTPPPPRGPYKAPPPEERHVIPPLRALRDLVLDAGVLAAAGLVVFAASTVAWAAGVLAVLLLVALAGSVLRPAVEGVLRSTIVLLGSRVHVRDEVAPERFLEATCLDAPVGREREAELYAAYVRWCGDRAPIAPWVFVERLRTLGLLLVKSSALEDGIWVGIRLRH